MAGHDPGLPSGPAPADDFDPDAGIDRWVADIDAGRCRVPEEWELASPQITVSLGDAADIDPALLAAMCGPDGLGGEAPSAAFGQDKAADVLSPGPVLSVLTEQAVSDLAILSDNQLTGALSAARRLENRAAYLQAAVIAEFARRREVQREEAKSRKVPLHCRPGQFPADELSAELVCTARYADERIWEATDLVTRLPRTLAGMADGRIDAARAYVIWLYTSCLTQQDAALADEILAIAAPGLRPDQLGRKAAALEMKLDPAAVRRRKERARQEGQRVQVRHERSGNAMLAGREIDPVTALAAKANIDALAVRLRNVNGTGSLQHLRAWVMTELLQGRNPLDHVPGPASHERDTENRGATDTAAWQDDPGYGDEDEDEAAFDPGFTVGATAVGAAAGHPESSSGEQGTRADGHAPLPALINLLVPAGTLLGWSTAPAQAGSWGLLDADETQAFTRAASRSPRTRWCVTITVILSFRVRQGCDLGFPVVDSVVDGTLVA